MKDADVDGAHIRTLLLILLLSPDARDYLRSSCLGIAQPPHYKVAGAQCGAAVEVR